MPVLLAKTTLLMQQKMVSDIAIRHADSQVNLIKALGGGYDANAELAALPSPQASHVLDAAATSSSHSTSKSEGAQ
jgi:hypothetical protein